MESYFLVVTGGSGMRCLEAFTHLAAIGMMPGREIHVLSIDTDTNNGNKDLAEQIVERYNKIRGGADQAPSQNSFFSAQIHLHKYAPKYSGKHVNFNAIVSNPGDTQEVRQANDDLASLFFEPAVREFNLSHGYRAQTHLGSMLMYHTILDAIRQYNTEGAANTRPENRQLYTFLNLIQAAGNQGRVFIMGSLFGGTGASSIPILPQAFQDAIKFSDPNFTISAKFGAVLLSNYFTFKAPDRNFLQQEKVVADARRFAINSQAALKYYISDDTINERFTRLYHIGWPVQAADFDKGNPDNPVTGGGGQKNESHVLELVCATAAYDFFFGEGKKEEQFGLVYRTVEFKEGLEFDYKDFFGGTDAEQFMLKMAAFYATNFLIHSEDGDLKVFTRKLDQVNNIHDYKELDIPTASEVNDYFKRFGFDLDHASRSVTPGWLQQVQKSTGDNDFLFISEAFSPEYDTLRDFDYGQILHEMERHFTQKKSWFSKQKGYAHTGLQYQKFVDAFGKTQVDESQNLQTLATKLLGRIHNTFVKLYTH